MAFGGPFSDSLGFLQEEHARWMRVSGQSLFPGRPLERRCQEVGFWEDSLPLDDCLD